MTEHDPITVELSVDATAFDAALTDAHRAAVQLERMHRETAALLTALDLTRPDMRRTLGVVVPTGTDPGARWCDLGRPDDVPPIVCRLVMP